MRWMVCCRKIVVALLGVLLLPINHGVAAETLVLSGSTTVQKRILEPSRARIEKTLGVKLRIKGIGTGGGFRELMEGKIEASLASSPIEWVLAKHGVSGDNSYQQHIITEDVIVPIINRTNPVESLSWQQLADIHSGKIRNWREVGGEDRKIVVITSHLGSATRAVFQKQVMQGAPYIRGVRQVKSTRREVNLVERIRGGVGAVSEGFVALNPGKVKVVQTDRIARPLSLITRGEPDPQIRQLLELLQQESVRQGFR